MKTIIARFHPQAWVNNYAIAVDPEGPTEFDVTAEIVAMGREAALAITDDDFKGDNLRFAAAAPQWVRNWSGPFYVEVAEAIAAYFGA